MLKLWKLSTAVFTLQLVVGGIVFYFGGDLEASALAAFVTASAVALVAAFTAPAVFHAVFAAVFAAAALSAVMLGVDAASAVFPAVSAAVFAVLAASVAASAASEAKKEMGNNESTVSLFIASCPAGIGTLVGGAILLWRYCRHPLSSKEVG